MGEQITTMSDWSGDEQEFAKVIIKIVESKHRKSEREQERILLEDIQVNPIHFEGCPYTPQYIKTLLRALWEKCELAETRYPDTYTLRKEGLLYKHLAEKLRKAP